MRWAALAAVSACAACARPSAPAPVAGEPELRVGLLTGVRDVTVAGQGRTAALRAGATRFRLEPGGAVMLQPEGDAVAAKGVAGGRHEALTFVPLDDGRFVTVNGKPYRGAVEVVSRGGALTVVNVVPLEAYLAGVVTAELGRVDGDARAALEAQAIVSRTYALRNRGRFGADGFDLHAGVSDQVYAGVGAETAAALAAVRATAGQVITWQGELIAPFFHSTCGFSTAAPEEVFRSVRGTSYLRPVSDRNGDGFYCDISPRFRWTVEWDGDQLRDILRRTVPDVLGIPADDVTRVRDVYVRRTGASGRAQEVRIAVDHGEIPVFGPDVRRVLEVPEGTVLGSQAVQLDAERADGRLVRLTASGAGWGHGVGMCQWGAIGRARAGQDAETILTTYFPGTAIARWY